MQLLIAFLTLFGGNKQTNKCINTCVHSTVNEWKGAWSETLSHFHPAVDVVGGERLAYLKPPVEELQAKTVVQLFWFSALRVGKHTDWMGGSLPSRGLF